MATPHMASHDCTLLGHVSVGTDPECLVCGMPMPKNAKVHLHIDRPGPVDDLPGGVADVESWGHAG